MACARRCDNFICDDKVIMRFLRRARERDDGGPNSPIEGDEKTWVGRVDGHVVKLRGTRWEGGALGD